MIIRSLLLGSVAVAGLTTAGYAADLGVVTSLDVCDELGISGISISSDDTCLTISGSVEFNMYFGDVNDDGVIDADDDNADPDGSIGLDFEAVSPTDFGPATAFISLTSDLDFSGIDDLEVDEAYVSVGDTTVVTAGYVESLFQSTVDVPDGAYDFDFFGPEFSTIDPDNNVVSFNVTHSVGDGFSIGGAVEQEVNGFPDDDTVFVGVASYAGNGIAAQVNTSYNIIDSTYALYAGFQGYFDPVTVVAKLSTDGTDYAATLGAAVVVDIFTLYGYVDTNGTDWELAGGVEAAVTDTVTLNLDSTFDSADDWTTELAVSVDVTETLTASAKVGAAGTIGVVGVDYFGEGKLAWEPVADTEFSATARGESDGTWLVTLSGSRDFD